MATATDISILVQEQLDAIEDGDTRLILESLLIDPVLQLREPTLGHSGAKYRTWLIAQSPFHPIGLAYAEAGTSPETPWGYVSPNHLSLGEPGQWFPTLEDVYWASDIQRGGGGSNRRKTQIPDLAATYLKHLQEQSPTTFWAWEEVHERIRAKDVDDAWAVLDALVAATDEETYGYIGAGPVEDFVYAHALQEIAGIERRAKQDARFRACLGRSWLSEGDFPDPITARLVAASGGKIKPLPPRERDV